MLEGVELHVCYGTFGTSERHPCKKAHKALSDAGYEPRGREDWRLLWN